MGVFRNLLHTSIRVMTINVIDLASGFSSVPDWPLVECFIEDTGVNRLKNTLAFPIQHHLSFRKQ
jgi:hypothetical protein